MTTSPTSSLHKPLEGERVPLGTLGYFRARNKHNAYALVIRELQKSGITKAELARRLGKEPAQITRYLSGPGNWTLDTLSDLLFAISGAEDKHTISYPLREAPRNDTRPAWAQSETSVGELAKAYTSPGQPSRPGEPILSLLEGRNFPGIGRPVSQPRQNHRVPSPLGSAS